MIKWPTKLQTSQTSLNNVTVDYLQKTTMAIGHRPLIFHGRYTVYSGTSLQGTRQKGKSAYKGNDLGSYKLLSYSLLYWL